MNKKTVGGVLIVLSIFAYIIAGRIYLTNTSQMHDGHWVYMKAHTKEYQQVADAISSSKLALTTTTIVFAAGLALVLLGGANSAAKDKTPKRTSHDSMGDRPRCSRCGRPVEADALFCPGCGVLMTRCSGCGNILDGDAKFCPNCGKTVTQEAVPSNLRRCETCGAVLEKDAVYCTDCGTKCEMQESIS